MDNKKLVLNIENQGNVSIISLNGFLDANTAPILENAIDEQINNQCYNIIVDFSDLDYISSAGLGVFMSQIETIRDNNGDLKLCKMKSKVFSVFELLGFPMLFEICDSIEECVKKFENG